MPTIEQVRAQIKALPHKYIFYTKREINYLPKIMADDEVIMALTSGYHGKRTMLLVCTNRRLLFVDKGMIIGVKVKQLNLDRIQSIDSSYIIVFGTIRIWDGAASYEITMILKDAIDPFVKAVRQAIEDYRKIVFRDMTGQTQQAAATTAQAPAAKPQPPLQAPQPQQYPEPRGKPITNKNAPDMLEMLERLAKLRQEGHLSDEEFEQQKQRLLTQG